jgi:hypothetical protein
VSAEVETRADDAPQDVETDAERLAGAIYGTIVFTGVLVAASNPGDGGSPDALDAAIYALATTAVFWLAHGSSLALARRVAGHPEARARDALRREWPMVAATAPLLAIMLVATLLGVDDRGTINAAVWGNVLVLVAIGVAIAKREGATRAQTMLGAVGCAVLGGLLVFLKVLVH